MCCYLDLQHRAVFFLWYCARVFFIAWPCAWGILSEPLRGIKYSKSSLSSCLLQRQKREGPMRRVGACMCLKENGCLFITAVCAVVCVAPHSWNVCTIGLWSNISLRCSPQNRSRWRWSSASPWELSWPSLSSWAPSGRSAAPAPREVCLLAHVTSTEACMSKNCIAPKHTNKMSISSNADIDLINSNGGKNPLLGLSNFGCLRKKGNKRDISKTLLWQCELLEHGVTLNGRWNHLRRWTSFCGAQIARL